MHDDLCVKARKR